jgi:predicted short-subunit dehydrogenase-like oxidoreductase (DUF2520 family)
MRISLIGCGKVGITILYYLKDKHQILGVHDIDQKAQARAIRILGVKEPVPYPEFVAKSEAVFIATPDDSIRPIARQIRSYLAKNAILIHFSGLRPADILPRTKAARRAAVHPFATFPRLTIPPPRRNYLLLVQADQRAVDPIRRIFQGKHFTLQPVRRIDKARIHLMGVLSSNLFVSLIDAVMQLTPRGPNRDKFLRQAILPLIEETLKNLHKSGIPHALSGPVKRGDLHTVKEHLGWLRKNKDLRRIYRSLSMNIVKFAPPAKKKALIKLLASE